MAAGRGTRMGTELPKQFMEIAGKAILHHTIDRFEMAMPDARMVVVLPANCIRLWKDYCFVHNLDTPQMIVEGGFTRFHSVKNAMSQIPDGALVAVHDGVRPLISTGLIRRMFEEAGHMEEDALIPVLPMVDTLTALRKDKRGQLEAIPNVKVDRDQIFAVQTPQLFKSTVIRRAYDVPYKEEFTDDASVLLDSGGRIRYCEGERFNLKITRPDDFRLATLLMKIR